MKRIIVCMAVSLVLASAAQAAEISTAKGTKQLVFGFQGLANIAATSYNVSGNQFGFGTRYYLSDGLALRPGIALSLSGDTDKPDETFPASTNEFSDGKTSNFGVGLSLAVESHRKGPANISPYMGAGFMFDMSSYSNEPILLTKPLPTVGVTTTKSTHGVMSFGLMGMTGFEWGFAESMTLGAEYRASFGFHADAWQDDLRDNTDKKVHTVKRDQAGGWGLGLSAASVYLSVAI